MKNISTSGGDFQKIDGCGPTYWRYAYLKNWDEPVWGAPKENQNIWIRFIVSDVIGHVTIPSRDHSHVTISSRDHILVA